MGFEMKDYTFYINGEPFKANSINVDITEDYDEKYSVEPLKFDAAKEATFSGEIENFNTDAWLKLLGLTWWQRTVVKVKWAFLRCGNWIRKLIS